MSQELLDSKINTTKKQQDLNTANGILAMGIISIPTSLVLGGLISVAPLILGIMAIVKGRQAISLFNDYPHDYTRSSLNKAKAGFVMGIIGVVLWGLMRLLMILVIQLI